MQTNSYPTEIVAFILATPEDIVRIETEILNRKVKSVKLTEMLFVRVSVAPSEYTVLSLIYGHNVWKQ